MSCGHAKELMASSWTGELDAAGETRLREHLSVCEECRAESVQLSAMWERLADLPSAEPSKALSARWDATLESLSLAQAPKRASLFSGVWRPVWQFAMALVCLVVGMLIGSQRRSGDGAEIAALRREVADTKEMVALSLLQQQSAGERLRGVDYSAQMRTLDPGVVGALIQAASHDPNVNVRLAAIDALVKVAGNPQVRQSMRQSLVREDSPMVQAALIDYVVDARDRGALDPLRQLTARQDLNPAIRQRAEGAVRQLLADFKLVDFQ